ncbi:hypothetical protein AAFF_G00287480 [Aldrovandia affinis]|uniref:Cadherin domain-containing protein n=1 Tax=Aldrovandia affinis TaxID=143900 RepID=A0AAD7SQN3_9TELE|nr:hypothetical protein AAFF_G00287480 [Aldrovandia affinis]
MEPAEDPQTSFRFMEEANSSAIHMRPTDGLLTVRELVDREHLCAGSPRCLINFDIVVFYKEKYQLIHVEIEAFDPDEGINGEVVYGLAEESSTEIKRVFKIDPFSGAVTLNAVVDYEIRRSYELNIQAYDLGVNPVPSTCNVIVEVVDVNDNAPDICIKPMTSMTDGVAYITEAAAEESFVALIRTSDRDSGSNGNVRVRLHGHEHFTLQQAYGDAFMIVTTTILDREKIPEYNLTVVAEDLGSPPFRTIKQYTIRARDADEGLNSELSFRILEDKNWLFSINKDSGDIVLKHGLTSVCGDMLEIKVAVSDKGRQPLSRSATVRFFVIEMEPSEDQITVVLQSNDEEYLGMDISVVVIIMLGGGCALLLIAIVTVGLSCKRDRKDRNYDDSERAAPGLFKRSSRNMHNSKDSNVFTEAGCLVNDQTTSSLDDSTCLYEERSGDSETKVFLPSKSFGPRSPCTKPSFEQVSPWQERKYSSSHSSPGSTDQLSVEDSGKGDSDFPDSGSDISDGSRRNPRTLRPLEKSTSHTASTLAMAQRGRPCVISNHRTNGYTIAFSHAPVYNHALANPASWKGRGYGTNIPKANGSLLRTATLSPHFCPRQNVTGNQPDEQSQQNQTVQTERTLSEVI